MARRAKVVVADFIIADLDHERRLLGDVAEPVALKASHEDELIGRVEDADALMLYHTLRLTEHTIGRLERCRLIVRCGVGYDNVDIAAARRHGIPVANVPDYGTEEVADSAIGLALSLTRGIHLLTGKLRERRGPWSYSQVSPLRRLRGRGFGVVGLGRIGTAVALRAKALGMDVLFHDPYVPDGRERSLGVRRTETLAELLAQSYVVSLHCPLTIETHHLINQNTLAQMAAHSYLVNTSRGGVVDAMAVLDAVTVGRLAGAALDVLEEEPPPENHPLVVAWRDPDHPAHDRLILNPHAAFYSEEGLLDMRLKGSENCRRVLLGQPPRNVVN
ncbi:MAG TPA: C-terminal binding protein [Gemmataceae bacterium]|nr:C-terminal binding protein [Gemmataceae bacterium]